jgi:hypothetical protein
MIAFQLDNCAKTGATPGALLSEPFSCQASKETTGGSSQRILLSFCSTLAAKGGRLSSSIKCKCLQKAFKLIKVNACNAKLRPAF